MKVKELVELFDRNGKEELQQGKGLNKKARRALAKKEKIQLSEAGMKLHFGASAGMAAYLAAQDAPQPVKIAPCAFGPQNAWHQMGDLRRLMTLSLLREVGALRSLDTCSFVVH